MATQYCSYGISSFRYVPARRRVVLKLMLYLKASTRRNKLIEKRVKLQDVRSCLQCKMRKISVRMYSRFRQSSPNLLFQCSENKLDPSEPCDLCMTQARRAKDLTMLYLTVDCIRTTFSEVDVFEYGECGCVTSLSSPACMPFSR